MGLWDYVKGGGFFGAAYDKAKGVVNGLTSEPAANAAQRENMNNQGGMSSWFADQGQDNYNALTAESAAVRQGLQRQASGENSMSREQLRQGLQSNMAGQRSMVASASPQNASMAALMGAQTMGRQSAGMSGQAAMAGIAERNAAQQQLAQMLQSQRQQDMQVALGSRGNAINAYGGVTPQKSTLEQYAPLIQAGTGAASLAASDRRLKRDVEDGDDDAKSIIAGLKAYKYKYKDEKYGKGQQFGPMAQEMERAGLGHTVVNTPKGKMVDGAKAALSGLGLIASLGKRLTKLEGGGK